MKNILVALIVGFIFALGLGLSGMTQPQKVIGFLDLFGHWDPSLMFVMLGAIGIHSITYKIIRKRKTPLFSSEWKIPAKKNITPALVFGSILFGIGWGLGGFCPGPSLVSMVSLQAKPCVFVLSMIAGMILFRQVDKIFKFNK